MEDKMNSPHVVGSVYVPFERRKKRDLVDESIYFDGSDFDRTFMSSIFGGVIAVLGVFFLAFAFVAIL